MIVPYGTVLTIDPHDTDTRGQSFVESLPNGDPLVSCEVSIVTGSCLLSASSAGTWASTAAATIANGQAIIWIKDAAEGQLSLMFRGTSAAGRRLDITETHSVQAR